MSYSNVPPPPPPMAGGAGPYYGAPAPQNGMGIASLVLGILGLLGCCSFVFSILAVIFGVMGRNRADAGLANNKGMATAGMIMGIIGLVIGGAYWIYSLVYGFNDWTFSTT